jgi:hypothetical protein
MPLTLRTNGNASSNIIQASWFNDYYNLLTGQMYDQAVTLRPNLLLKSSMLSPAAITSATAATGTGLGIGSYQYVYTVTGPDGHESLPSAAISATTTSGNQQVQVTIPSQPTGAGGVNLYRTKVGGSTFYLIPGAIGLSAGGVTYTDQTADTSLNTSVKPPIEPRYNGALILQNGVGSPPALPTDILIIAADGSIYSPGHDLYVKTDTNINFQSPNGTTVVQINSGGMDLLNTNLTVNQFLQFHDYDGNAGAIIASGAGIGFRKGTTKLAEVLGNGNFVISGTTYYSTRGTAPGLSGGGTFDGFDIAECYRTDQEYPSGTVVCPADVITPVPFKTDYSDLSLPIMTQCTHDACTLANVVTAVPGYCMGVPNVPSMTDPAMPYNPDKPMSQPISMVGKVFVKCAYDIPGKVYVTSDGRGGVRQVQAGEKVQAIGVSLAPTNNGMIPLMIRPMFVSL